MRSIRAYSADGRPAGGRPAEGPRGLVLRHLGAVALAALLFGPAAQAQAPAPAPAPAAPAFTAPPSFAELAQRVTPAVVNVAVTQQAGRPAQIPRPLCHHPPPPRGGA